MWFHSVGIRFFDCSFQQVIEKYNLPFTSTSVNLSGKSSALKLSDISGDILNQVDYIIERHNLSGHSTTIIDLRNNEKKSKTFLFLNVFLPLN